MLLSLLEHLLQDAFDALAHSGLYVELDVKLELVFRGQVSPFSLETHNLPDAIGPRPHVGLRPDNGKCRWYTLLFISNFTFNRTEEKNLSASRFSPSTAPVKDSIPRRPASSVRRPSRSLPIPLDCHRSSTTIAISASRTSCRAYMAWPTISSPASATRASLSK